MKKIVILLVILMSIVPSSQAISVGEITTTITSDKEFIAKEIKNTTDSARLVTVNVVRISSPMSGGDIIPMESKKELLSTPANIILPGNTSDNVRFFYDGPKDDKERYYRIQWTDDMVSDAVNTKTKKNGVATTSAAIDTILVVAPRKENFNYARKDNIIYNRGNVTFRVVAFGPCVKSENKSKDNICRERYYVMPGFGVKINYSDTHNRNSHIGIWHGERYIIVK